MAISQNVLKKLKYTGERSGKFEVYRTELVKSYNSI